MGLGGGRLAGTRGSVLLFETSLPMRAYIPREDVRMDLLVPTGTHTRCAYKGEARYWSVEGAGAAGGLGFGLMCFGGGSVIPGAPWVLDRVGFPALLEEAGLVLVGEARFDRTSLEGKLPGEVLQIALRRGVPAALVAPHAAQPLELARHHERLEVRAVGR